MHIRPANDDQDIAVIQGLFDEAYPEPAPNARQVVKNQQVRVAEDDNGSAIGFRALWQSGFVWVAVVLPYRQRGIGRLLMEDALQQASALGMPELTSRVLTGSAAGTAFCERFRFNPYVYAVNLSLDLTHWDEPSLTAPDQTQMSDVRFVTYAELGDNAVNRQKLYTLNKMLSATIPRDQPQPFADFDAYVERRLSNKTMPHDGIFIALMDGEWIGMSQMSLEETCGFNQMTGVLPAYRGRGIAKVLKVLSVRFAERNHQKVVRTFNDVSNDAMIAVNEWAGFRQRQRFYLVRRKPLMEVS